MRPQDNMLFPQNLFLPEKSGQIETYFEKSAEREPFLSTVGPNAQLAEAFALTKGRFLLFLSFLSQQKVILQIAHNFLTY